MISQFLDVDALYEERALLLGRIGRHEQALSIYAHVLRDHAAAENYCRKQYSPEKEGAKDVYLSLLTVSSVMACTKISVNHSRFPATLAADSPR